MANSIVLFESADGNVTLPVTLDRDANEVLLARNGMAELFGRDVKTVGKHINNALREELAGAEIELSQNLRQLLLTVKHIRLSTTPLI